MTVTEEILNQHQSRDPSSHGEIESSSASCRSGVHTAVIPVTACFLANDAQICVHNVPQRLAANTARVLKSHN